MRRVIFSCRKKWASSTVKMGPVVEMSARFRAGEVCAAVYNRALNSDTPSTDMGIMAGMHRRISARAPQASLQTKGRSPAKARHQRSSERVAGSML